MLNHAGLLIGYVSACFVLIIVLAILLINMLKSNNEYKKEIGLAVVIGIFTILFYCIFLFTKTIFWAVFWDGAYFILTDWLAFSMLLFGIDYTGIGVKYKKQIRIAGIIVCSLDSISIFINNFTHHMFNLLFSQGFIGDNGIGYLSNQFYFTQYIHLGICYIFVGATFVMLLIKIATVPSVYKTKYTGILGSYIFVILANFVSYTLSLPIDFSVILYGMLAGFVCYYSTYFYPEKIIYTALQNVQRIMSDALIYYDMDGVCLFANKSAKELFDMEDEFDPSVLEDYRINFLGKEKSAEHLIRRAPFIIDGEKHYFEVEYTKITIKSKKSVRENGYILKFVEKTREINHVNREKYLATHDELTGIYNRTGFFEEVEKYIDENGIDNCLMVCSNIQDFKLINDLFGQVTGDQILKKQAKLLKQFSHKNTIYGRVGDDKFALFTRKDFFSEEKFSSYIEEMQKVTASAFYRMNVYVGIYTPYDINENVQSMYNKALLAIENVKGNYESTYSYYESVLMEKIKEENEIMKKFDTALSSGQFKIHLQPIFDSSRNIIGAEALARWYDPLKGIIYPDKFIKILEKYGLIFNLDSFIWEESVKTLKSWIDRGITDKYISVNVSIKDFFYTDIFDTFSSLVEKYNVNPQLLHIEFSETMLMSDYEKTKEMFDKLREYGFSVAIDNFGNGYSSLNMLKNYEVDVLKIDVGFLQDAEENYRNNIILEAIIELALELNMTIIPAGVETAHHFDILSKLKCHGFQGNYFDMPMSISDFEKKFYH